MLAGFASLTVIGVGVSRWRHAELPRPVRTWGWPITPLLLLISTGWGIAWTFSERPTTDR